MSLLQLFVREDPSDPERVPVTTELIESLREVLADGVNDGYDIDAVLFQLALAIMNLETTLVERQSQLLSLERRILEAGLRVRPAD